MDKNLIQFLNSFGMPLGTWIAVIIGVATFISGILIAVKKFKKTYDNNLKKKLKKAEENKKFHDSVKSIASAVSDIQSNLNSLRTQHQEVTDKLNEVCIQLNQSKAESEAGDKALKDEIKSYVAMIDTIDKKISNMDEKTTLLIESDKEGIKSYIIDKYYQAQYDGYIELHVLQTLELRYEKYLQENGNTYVGKLMSEIRRMPNEKPNK